MIYLDYNASTPLDLRVREAVVDALDGLSGNAASVQHQPGQSAARAIDTARGQVAALVSASPQEVIFTSGASEGLSLAVLGAAFADPRRPNIVISAVEHKAAHTSAELAARLGGGEVRIAPVTDQGVIDQVALKQLLTPDVGLAVVMHSNNETGAVNDVAAVAELAHAAGATYLCDVTQSVGKIPVDMSQLGADMLVLSSHKVYGPKGAGALVASRHVQRRLVPVFPGGGQERGLRGGTQDTPAIVGFGVAAELAAKEQPVDARRIAGLLETFLSTLRARLGGVKIVGPETGRIPNTVNLHFEGADAEAIMASTPNVAVSTGSACQAAVPTVSHVLLAMGLSRAEASECLRISLGRPTTNAEVLTAASALADAVERVRSMTAA